MKKETYTCDECKKIIDGTAPFPAQVVGGGTSIIAGGGELCTLSYMGVMGHNGFPNDKHYHYQCFCKIVRRISRVEV